jgi:hypothetical protein
MKLASWVCKQPGIRDIEVYGDSVLIICQTVGDWKTRDPKWIPYREYLEELTIRFRKITLTYMPKRIRSQSFDGQDLRRNRHPITVEARGEPARPANKIEPGHLPAKMKILVPEESDITKADSRERRS